MTIVFRLYYLTVVINKMISDRFHIDHITPPPPCPANKGIGFVGKLVYQVIAVYDICLAI